MLKRALALLGLGTALATTAAAAPTASPDPALHEPMFCDRPELYRPTAPGSAAPWQALLFNPAADTTAVRALADDATADSRVRALAYGWLRQRGAAVPRGELLGVVFEIVVNGGLDVLVAYGDGRLRYLNHAGGVAVIDALTPALRAAWQALIDHARPAAERAPAWLRQGAAPPGPGGARLVFLRSDGLHARQGRFDELQRDPATGPVLLAGAQMLAQIVQVRR